MIVPALKDRLFPYMGGIARENGIKALAIGGTEDHVHVLISLPSTMAIAKAVQLVKAGSAKWVHEEFREHTGFAWQEGYAAFSVSVSHVEPLKKYIAEQVEHHKKRTFAEEFLALLEKHGIEYDQRYVWG